MLNIDWDNVDTEFLIKKRSPLPQMYIERLLRTRQPLRERYVTALLVRHYSSEPYEREMIDRILLLHYDFRSKQPYSLNQREAENLIIFRSLARGKEVDEITLPLIYNLKLGAREKEARLKTLLLIGERLDEFLAELSSISGSEEPVRKEEQKVH